MPSINIKPTYFRFPDALKAPDKESFLRPRNLSELGGVDVYLKFATVLCGY